MKIIFLDEMSVNWRDDIDFTKIKKLGTYQPYPQTQEKDVIKRAGEADILITNKVPVTKEILQKLNHVKLICVAATGYNNIDIKAAQARRIVVTNVAGYSTDSVAEQALMFMLNFFHRFPEHDAAVKTKEWQDSIVFCETRFPYREAKGKTLGIIGYGHIGQAVAKRAKAFGMKILKAKMPGRNYAKEVGRVSVVELLQKSDVVSLHCPLTSETKHLIDEDALQHMRPEALLINLSRGEVVDEKAVAKALMKRQIKAYASDVFANEPPPKNHPLLNYRLKSHVMCSPHIAWGSVEARQRLIDEIAKNIMAFQKGLKRNQVS